MNWSWSFCRNCPKRRPGLHRRHALTGRQRRQPACPRCTRSSRGPRCHPCLAAAHPAAALAMQGHPRMSCQASASQPFCQPLHPLLRALQHHPTPLAHRRRYLPILRPPRHPHGTASSIPPRRRKRARREQDTPLAARRWLQVLGDGVQMAAGSVGHHDPPPRLVVPRPPTSAADEPESPLVALVATEALVALLLPTLCAHRPLPGAGQRLLALRPGGLPVGLPSAVDLVGALSTVVLVEEVAKRLVVAVLPDTPPVVALAWHSASQADQQLPQ
eukprot:CAMPEP_0175564650 /NCGR_PEP_ID=MMETSP0096-20121207/39047_1 /TAXON_ID=311494 /ORGANISM="Alexandrium monilatum, Strain CCMP3105" /LENGTH=273 /DNA_ID=CAMNT_0016867931 /DNA_START=57 /DNA_END=880 /DNA_ORIENTATION=-